ncbi:MAG: polymer-forming cytoskeletal protein [Chloroflexi bacterium]|nr:polymer-forming cytoskeletal protein [Chloroflexota bacterium]
MKTSNKFLSTMALLALLLLTITSPAHAFDGRGGESVIIAADEVINDDLYVGANEFVLDGTVNGDVVAAGTTITINGTVNGDLIAAAQTVVINGTITDDARIAGAALQVGTSASIGGDLVAAGASLETKKSSKVQGEIVVGAGQSLLAGDAAGDVLAGAGAVELRGEFGGDVQAYVDVMEGTESRPPMNLYMTNIPITLPSVDPGLTISDEARIAGDLTYTSTIDLSFPASAIEGRITRVEPVVEPEAVRIQPTRGQLALKWTLDLLRDIVTLILFGLLLAWLVPGFMKSLMDKIHSQPAASLGWGLVTYAGFFFLILLVIVVMIVGGVVFGFLTLGGVSGTIIVLGILAIFELIVAFVLITAFLTKIIIGWWSGRWILGRFNPSLAENKIWPLVLGVSITALAIALPFVGWLFGLVVTFLGLGALWLWGRSLWQNRATA